MFGTRKIEAGLGTYPDPAELPTEELEVGFGELQRLSQMIEAKRLQWLAELDRRRSHRRDGHLSTRAWLSDRFHLSRGQAKEEVRTAQALREMPQVQAALADGQVSSSAVRMLVATCELDPDAFRRSEPVLLRTATQRPVGELRRVVDEWSRNVRGDGGLDAAERASERRRLEVWPCEGGMVRVDGELDPEGGEQVMTALQALVDAAARTGRADLRTPGQRRADALAELARRYLDSSDRQVVGGERPHVAVTVDLQVLRGLDEGCGELHHAGAVPAKTAERLSCDASVRRVVLDPASESLDIGRRTAVVPPALRQALAVRDRGCRFPGCGRPQSWTDAHHVRHWAKGGETRMDNLLLLCRPHHRLVHEGGFSLEMNGGRPMFRRPDGSVLEDRAPP